MKSVPLARSLVAACALLLGQAALAAEPCAAGTSAACYLGFTPPGQSGQMHYLASPASEPKPSAALVAVHGHPRDANKTLDAALLAVQRADATARTLVVAPVFQVADADKCRTAGVPAEQAGDLLWTCTSWIAGEPARNAAGLTSFAAMDALVQDLLLRWPSLRSITIAGFSAGAQMVQHYIGFAADAPAGVALRYVVADPGSWLYFDAVWQPETVAACPNIADWKYGIDKLPATLQRSAAEARARYAQADVHYLEGALDSSAAAGTFYKILDKSCAAQAQGPYRLQRGLAYAEYDRSVLAPKLQRQVQVVPGCAHDVACVFPSAEARSALLGR
ncbi:hypothetical protein [Rhodoferax sp.]|uniref:hypothetical protein n=1 Tax=Rhodoferax sp. TaxID=50421 RepID=UPI00374CFDEB